MTVGVVMVAGGNVNKSECICFILAFAGFSLAYGYNASGLTQGITGFYNTSSIPVYETWGGVSNRLFISAFHKRFYQFDLLH